MRYGLNKTHDIQDDADISCSIRARGPPLGETSSRQDLDTYPELVFLLDEGSASLR